MDIQSKISDIDLFVLDMDGTIYLGDNVIDGAREFCRRILDSGRKMIYFTNNSFYVYILLFCIDFVIQQTGFPLREKERCDIG